MLEGTVQPQLYDILLLDLGAHDLSGQISTQLAVHYLDPTEQIPIEQVKGIIYGSGHRLMIALPVRINRQTRWVIFLVDTGSPSTYLSHQAVAAFELDNIPQNFSVLINGQRQLINLPPSNSHFTDINILGTDFLQLNNCKLNIDFGSHQFTLVMGSVE